MSDYAYRIPNGWQQTLKKILAQAAKSKKRGLVVFDLDSTVFDNRPRQARIVREFGAATKQSLLQRCQEWHFESGWELDKAVIACGVSATGAQGMSNDLKAFWKERFFTSKYCVDDIEVVGAPRYLHALVKTGVQVIYVTGRHEEMREGTTKCLKRCGMPLPDAATGVQLVMKPTLEEKDDDFKKATHAALQKQGKLIAAFDNEPMHINDYAEKFKNAIPVHLATDHSGRPVKLNDRCVSIPHFAY